MRYRRWFRRELSGYLEQALDEGAVRLPFWNREFSKGLADRHISGEKNCLAEINAVLTLEAVQRLLIANAQSLD